MLDRRQKFYGDDATTDQILSALRSCTGLRPVVYHSAATVVHPDDCEDQTTVTNARVDTIGTYMSIATSISTSTSLDAVQSSGAGCAATTTSYDATMHLGRCCTVDGHKNDMADDREIGALVTACSIGSPRIGGAGGDTLDTIAEATAKP
jgi:hypothetical protein